MVLLSLWVGISSLPRLAAGGRGGRGSAGRREGLGRPSLSGSRGRPPGRPARLARGAERRGASPPQPAPRRSSRRAARHASRRGSSHHARSRGRIPRQGGRRSCRARRAHPHGGRNGIRRPTARRSQMGSVWNFTINSKMKLLNGNIPMEKPIGHTRSGLIPPFLYLVASAASRLCFLDDLLRGFLGFGVPVGFWDLFLKYREPRFFCISCLPRL